MTATLLKHVAVKSKVLLQRCLHELAPCTTMYRHPSYIRDLTLSGSTPSATATALSAATYEAVYRRVRTAYCYDSWRSAAAKYRQLLNIKQQQHWGRRIHEAVLTLGSYGNLCPTVCEPTRLHKLIFPRHSLLTTSETRLS